MNDSQNSNKNTSQKSTLIENELFKNRSILIFGEINMEIAKSVSGTLLALSAKSTKDINVYINSPGGHVESGDTIHDVIKYIKNRVNVIGTGWVASAGVLIYLGAKKENRYSLPNTRFLLHQPSGSMQGPASDIEIHAHEIIKMKDRINKIVSESTGQSISKIEKHTDRDFWLTAKEAKNFGIVGKIIKNNTDIGVSAG